MDGRWWKVEDRWFREPGLLELGLHEAANGASWTVGLDGKVVAEGRAESVDAAAEAAENAARDMLRRALEALDPPPSDGEDDEPCVGCQLEERAARVIRTDPNWRRLFNPEYVTPDMSREEVISRLDVEPHTCRCKTCGASRSAMGRS